ncbi:hypothetical protein BaRGS_00026157 [Batillaria attramentaria]|uniref:Uncharacterized protein n=1 Tax=Batillaria attramentaria TaxID=370345 RepID=A0ABD0K5F1_9CAEN
MSSNIPVMTGPKPINRYVGNLLITKRPTCDGLVRVRQQWPFNQEGLTHVLGTRLTLAGSPHKDTQEPEREGPTGTLSASVYDRRECLPDTVNEIHKNTL